MESCFKQFEDSNDNKGVRRTNYCRECFYALRALKFYLDDNDPLDYMGRCDYANASEELKELVKVLRTASPKDKHDYLEQLRRLVIHRRGFDPFII